jgi:SAM-dependent methyltransferase
VKDRLHDAAMAWLDARGLGERRRLLVGGVSGRVLEIGAGTGTNLDHYPDGLDLMLVEPSARYRARLERRSAGRIPRPRVISARAERLPVADASVDHVVCCLVLCSVEDPGAAAREIARVLAPGGSVHLLEHVRGTARLAAWQRRLNPLQRRLADGCHLDRDPRPALEDAGLVVTSWERFRFPRAHPAIRDGVQGTAVRRA